MTSLNIYSKEQTDSLLADKADADDLATVATTGSYDDLTDKPVIPSAVTVDSALSSESTNPVQNAIITDALANKADSSSLSAVATSGDYNDLTNKPSIPSAPVQSNWNETDTTSLAYIQNKPTIPSGVVVDSALSTSSTNPVQNAIITTEVNKKANSTDLAAVATTGAYSDLTGTPSLATVATTGDYDDLTDKPVLATVATTGSYNDLTNKPTIPQGLPATTGASSGNVLSLDSNLDPVWSTASGGGLTAHTYSNFGELITDW